jgi:hypothetical protein
MGRNKGEGRITTSVTISPTFWFLAKKHEISISEALRVGLSLLFAELGEAEYDNNLNLYRKMVLFKDEVERLGNELAKYQSQVQETQANA